MEAEKKELRQLRNSDPNKQLSNFQDYYISSKNTEKQIASKPTDEILAQPVNDDEIFYKFNHIFADLGGEYRIIVYNSGNDKKSNTKQQSTPVITSRSTFSDLLTEINARELKEP